MNRKRLISAALALAVALSLLPPLPGIMGEGGGVPAAQALSGSASYTPVESNLMGKYWVSLSADSAAGTAALVADGDLSTAWAPEGDGPHALTADLSGAYDAIRKTQIVFADAAAANKYKLECSGDGESWELLADRSQNERPAGGFTDVFSRRGIRYLRLTVWGGAAVSELSAFNYLRADLKNGSDMSELGSQNTVYYYYNRENNPPQPGARGGRLTGEDAGPASSGDNIFGLVKDMGWSALRLRVWNEPRNERTGVPNNAATNCSPANTLLLAPYVTGAGLDLAIDFHYSDSWADPSKQTKPYAWADLPFDELVEAQHDFTYEMIDALVEQGTAPSVVAIGNEVTEGMLWGAESGAEINGSQPGGKILWQYWHEDQATPEEYQRYLDSLDRFAALVDAGIRAVRKVELESGAEIATEIHIAFGSSDTGENLPRRLEFLRQLTRRLDAKGSALDRVGVSYYPNWHGTWAMLERYLVEIHREFPELAINISECSPRNSGSYSNDPNEPTGSAPSVQKQGDDFARIMQILNDTPDNIGAGVWSWAGSGTGQYGPVNFTTSGPQREPYASMKVFRDAFATGVVESGVYATARQGSLPDLPAAVTELDVETGAAKPVPVEWEPIDGERLISASGYVVEGTAAATGNMSAVRAYVSVLPNPPGDSAALAAIASNVGGMAESAALAYTAESAGQLGDALQKAQAALASPDTAQVVIDARYEALVSALGALAPKPEFEVYSELLELLADVPKFDAARYTASSWSAVKSVEDEAWAYIAQNGGQPQAAQEAAMGAAQEAAQGIAQEAAQHEAQQAAPRSDAAEAEGGAPEAGAAEARQEAEAPATGAQEAEAPGATGQEAGEPGTGAPEAAEPDAAAPEAVAQGTEALLAAALEAGAQAAEVLEETGAQAAEAAEAESQGAAAPEAGAPEIAEREAAAPETGALDAEAQDAAAQETEAPPAFYGARPSAPNAGDSPDSQAALSAPSEAWLPAVPGASAAEAAYEALAEDLAFGIKDLASRLRAAIDGLVRLPSELPAERRKMSAGVFELAGDKEFVIERTMGPATADYAFIGEGFQDVGSFSVLLSFRTADVAGCTVSLPEWLASDAYVLADSAPPYMPGYTTYAIDVIARDKTFSAGDGETILDVSLTLSGKTTRIVSLVLSSFDAVYYDEAFDGGKYDIEADASITRAVASTRVSFASRFDANRDGIVNLVDVNRTRQYMGSVLDENGWRPSQAAWSCDIGGGLGNAPDGIVNVVDLTLVIAAYEATVP